MTSDYPYDWRIPQNDALWGAVKTANDPSPSGWRVPTTSEFESLYDLSKVSWDWDDVKKGYTVTDISSGSFLFLPAAGYRYYNSGTVFNVGTYGYYWSSTVSGVRARGLNFNSSNVIPANGYNRSLGFSVRCVAE